MIVRYEKERTLVDCEALTVDLAKNGRYRSPATIRKYCQPVAIDPATGRQLFDADAAKKALENVPTRSPHRRKRRS